MSDLVAIFEANAKEAAAGVTRVATSGEEVRAAVMQVAGDSSSIVLSLDEFLPRDIAAGLREIPTVLQPTDEQLSRTEIGINAAFAGVASTGSVCIAMGPPLAAAASLLMPLHIVLLSVDRIVARPRDLFEPECLGGEGLRRNLVFITGPSATADMGPLVRGVHGPHRLQILLMG